MAALKLLLYLCVSYYIIQMTLSEIIRCFYRDSSPEIGIYVCETPEWLHGLEQVTRAHVRVMSS